MIKIIVSVIICGLVALLVKLINPGFIRNQKEFNFTILFALITVVAFFIAEKIVGVVLVTYGLGILAIVTCLAILVVSRQSSQLVAETEEALDDWQQGSHTSVEAEVNLPVADAVEVSETNASPERTIEEEDTSYSEEESGSKLSGEQEAIDELIKQFFKQNEEKQTEPEIISDFENDSPVFETAATPVIETYAGDTSFEETPFEEEQLEQLSVSPAMEITNNANQETLEVQPKDNEEILFNYSWKQVLASLEETGASQSNAPAVFEDQEDLLISDLSALLKDEMGESAEKLIVEAKPKPDVVYQAPVHKNTLENEKASSIVLKMDELVVANPPDSSSGKAVADDRQSLFELEELIDPGKK